MTRFSDSQWMTAKEKELTLKQFEQFFKSYLKNWDNKEEIAGDYGSIPKGVNFGKRVYYHLHQHCGYIAHYNQMGFYSNQFDHPVRFLENIQRWAKDEKLGWGRMTLDNDYGDLNTEIVKLAQEYLPKARELVISLLEEQDREAVDNAKKLLESRGYEIKEGTCLT